DGTSAVDAAAVAVVSVTNGRDRVVFHRDGHGDGDNSVRRGRGGGCRGCRACGTARVRAAEHTGRVSDDGEGNLDHGGEVGARKQPVVTAEVEVDCVGCTGAEHREPAGE